MNPNHVFAIISILSAMQVFTHIFWAYQYQKLADKLMSKNFAEYKQAESIGKTPERTKVVLQTEPEEDLGAIQGVNL